jgi:preprotein translocase subunit SecA
MSAGQAETICGHLTSAGVPHEALTARDYEREAEILGGAGRPGAVTVVVQMAGRGVDILPGGSSGADHDRVADAGGLCVLGAGRSGERRTELHLRGRAGRQGDPGESRFFISAEDELPKQLLRMSPVSLLADGKPFSRLSASIDRAQARTTAQRAAWLLGLVGYDDVLAKQQRLIYAGRRELLDARDLHIQLLHRLDDVVQAEVIGAIKAGHTADQLVTSLKVLYPASVQPGELVSIYRRNAASDRSLAATSGKRPRCSRP